MAIGSTTAIKELVKHNVGITFLYRFAVQKELEGKVTGKNKYPQLQHLPGYLFCMA
jgi:DNA-binding transcriptional LysR family regulator